MRDTEYAHAVAVIRANENKLLTRADLDALALAESYQAALQWLESKGWKIAGADPDRHLDERLNESWRLICEVAPDREVLSFLTVPNDFHNAKAALKSFFSGSEARFVSPYSVEPSLFKETLVDKEKLGLLPSYLAAALKKAHEALSQTMDGQLAEAILDAAALDTLRRKGEATGSVLIRGICEMTCAFADIKICFRAIMTKKGGDFLDIALCGTDSLPKRALMDAAQGGLDGLFELLRDGPYGDAAEKLKVSLAEYERFCDDRIIEYAKIAKLSSFGPEPLVAYFLARQSEVKNVRIILACKRSGMPLAAIRERERMLYV
ncbi:MAG: V-type ATPase subunit [Clostridiales bacterium]|jgi:V/A-type H+-transporting ATPase subunit C|nr:V-type ATPase subunit [Clostridiales bacterium]